PWQVGKFLDFYQWAKLNHPIYGSQGDPQPFQQQVLTFQIDPSAGAYNPGTPGTTPEAEANEVLERVPVEPSVDLSQVVDMLPTLGRTGTQEPAAAFIRGDVDGNGKIQIGDPVYGLMYQFAEGAAPPCVKAADFDDDGAIQISDPISLLNYLFSSGPAPKAPFPDCGEDPTADTLGCKTFTPCQTLPPPMPDLTITSTTHSPSPLTSLTPATFTIVFGNIGNADAKACTGRIGFGRWVTTWHRFGVPSIRAGREYTLTYTTSSPPAKGEYVVNIGVDSEGVVEEADETNNTKILRLFVR
ncbi:MAG: hypothetical protein JXP34_19370, partial [Planctomycetes bacterium]|nr:hypothetical protein [Planctomycetota bacterium]